ncbi:Elongator protein 3/MiaB/NifB [Macleaya cordata]|uniref:biotin synthase n=1 Tax=Macleaya cordata TaxID=56857 RepID=A0A200Q2C2_MACCD|nr:Elongator protein 3/MiaB/NifB [Macleaya cordata]
MLMIRSLRPRLRPLIFNSSFSYSSLSSSPSSSSSSAAAVQAERTIREGPRNDWSRDEIKSVYDSPVLDLLFHGAQVHRHAHNFREVQQCTLLSVKTGGCSEDCSYCPQSSRYDTGLKAQKLMNKDAVLQAAEKAKEAGSTRFCMGAAWRDTVGRKTNFNQILEYVKEIRGMGMEVCCTLGMIEKQQAVELKKAGLTAYNHNLDTSREYYPNIITTRSYDERLETLQFVREAGINVCSGGIIGLGEAEEDRVGLLHTLATLPTHPESVPINALVAVKGTPLEDQKLTPTARVVSQFLHQRHLIAASSFLQPVEIWEMIRMIATARIVMPKAMVRLSAGRVRFNMSEQALCFLAGANSIFTGEKLLTTPNNDFDADQLMFKVLGLTPKAPSFDETSTPFEAERCEEATASSSC